MPTSPDPPSSRNFLADKIRESAIRLHWFNHRPGKEDEAWALADELMAATLAYQSLLRDIHRAPERGSSEDP